MQNARTVGFTVIEVFMVITLLVLLAGLMVVPVQRLLDAVHVRPFEQVFLSTVRRAHMQARRRNIPVVLSYLAASNRLQLATQDGIVLENVDFEPPAGTEEDTSLLDFHRILPEDPEGREAAFESEDEPTRSIIFHPSGFSTPFAVDLKDRGIGVRLVLDPFSSEPVLRDEGSHGS